MLQSTLASATATTYVAFNPIPIPGLSDRLNTFGGWATFLAYFACAVAIVVGGGFIAWDKITDRGDSKGVKIAISSIVGTMVIATGATILQAAGGQ
ncbi:MULTISPECIES: hypothetical protein [Gordonia]|jgi:hypothetical protein|uniref:TrbC/VirB2 family protein n=1 Tax=Gordonia rubripertincta TaxID=36822 RepID=A0AAW4G9V4_GORRU|nr:MULTISPECIES: hypothetical protein [Gordonia]MBM7280506.1 hypothetical protein [Gordonia rubripertincta]MBN0974193.1 hypothetical protein [Gordonia sp. BP-119]MBN0983923.1 hypothetical protein [Gordonia sp. BP-94]QMU23521.1 hypothetical protein H3V45_23710 [Gordonia rubripertincta]